jgi:hypothetical protein
MAASGKTARRLLQFFKPADAPTISAWSEALANQLDNDVEIKRGKLSERSAPSLFGRLFYVEGDATAANNGILWLDLGATWVPFVEARLGQTYSALKTYTALEAGVGVTPSTSRDAIVTFSNSTAVGQILVGGVQIGHAASGGFTQVFVPAGTAWKYPGEVETSTLLR